MLESDVITGDRLVMEKSVTASEAIGDGGRSEDPFGLSGSRKAEETWNERKVSQTHTAGSVKTVFSLTLFNSSASFSAFLMNLSLHFFCH